MNPIKQKYLAMTIPTRRAFWMGIILTALLLTSSLAIVPGMKGIQNSLQYVSVLTPPIIGLFTLASIILMLNGRVKLAGQIIIYAVSFGMVAISLVAKGYGAIGAAVVLIITSVIATQTMPERESQRRIWTSLTFATTILLIDFFWPFYRLPLNPVEAVSANILTVILVLIFGGLLVSQFNSLPLNTKLVIVILTLSVSPMAVVGYASTVSSREALVKNADESLVSSAVQVAGSLDAFIKFNLDTVRTQAQLGEFIEVLEMAPEERPGSEALEDTNNMLAAFKQRDPIYITSYAIFDINGLAIADTSVEEIGLVKADREYFREPLATGVPYVSDVRTSPVTGDTSIYISAPIRNPVGEYLGVLRVRYDANILQQLVLTQGNFTGRNVTAMLVSNENILLVHTNQPWLVFRSIVPLTEQEQTVLQEQFILPAGGNDKQFVDMPDLVTNIASDKIGTGFVGEFHEADSLESEHTEEQANSVRMNNRPWTVVVAQSQEVLLAPVARQERGNIVAGIVAGLVAMVIGGLVARYLALPVVTLTDVARQVSAGNLNARATVTSRDEIGTLAGTFNQMAGQLSSMVTGLEQRVADRTKALATSAEVSRRLSTILDQDELVREVVNQLQRAFDYYHVHIYLLDAEQGELVMAGGTGEAGQVMLARGHRIPRGRGLVGRAAESGVPVLVPNVTIAEGWLANPLLPDTRSELAVPIILGDQVLGVLDVQQNRVEGLKQDDVDLLQSIANQVAVGLQNAQTYAATQRRAEREATISAISQRIQLTTSTEEALKVAVREIGRITGKTSTVHLGVANTPASGAPGIGGAENGAADGQKNIRDN